MTSRTPTGAQQRPLQRTSSLNSATSSQRPNPQRSLSQQILPSTPARASSGETISESTDASLTRQHVNKTPNKRTASKLRLELSNEGPGNVTPNLNSPSNPMSARLGPGGDAMSVATASSPAASKSSHQDIDNPPLPMPKRRQPTAQHTSTPREQATAAVVTAKKDARPKPYTVQPPSDAPKLALINRNDGLSADIFGKGLLSGRADFFPWNGNHHEDEWSTESITKGTWEKHTPADHSSARLGIFSALRSKQSLGTLSNIFTNIFHQKRQRGQITAPSTFKPPPRVTLTDTKREVWLKDLANPATSLRRLSRTIPHGIRGRALLDQCLNKRVPTERAVWLAKCVGANEIRANKRKSVNGAVVLGGEFKWCRDWTIFVEQFVESVVSSTIDQDWKSRVVYATRLATSLYAEQLLDRDHYLEWVLGGLESSQQGRLPMWILIARIYWTDILKMRKYGSRLVYSLLKHMHTISNDADRDILHQLSGQLNMMVSSLIHTNPESFLSPTSWPKYRETLKASLTTEDEVALKAYNSINTRNSRLAVAGTTCTFTGRQQLVKLLDSTLETPISSSFNQECWATCDDKFQLTRTLVEWATSDHRPGLAKVYVAAKLLTSWSTISGFGVTSCILGILDDIAPENQTRKHLVYHLVTNLVRNDSFSVPQYLKWLIARGGYHDASDIDPDTAPCATRLLLELPVYCLQDRVKCERTNLLRRAGGFSTIEEDVDMANALKFIDHAIGLPLPFNDPLYNRKPIPLRKLLVRINKSSMALKSRMGNHLQEVTVNLVSQTAITLAFFVSARSILETTEDFVTLLDVVKTCAKTTEPDILAACADTINCNLKTFLPLGLASEVFTILLTSFKSLVHRQSPNARPFLAAMSHLANRMPGCDEVAGQLIQELVQNDRSNAIDACSPVSDSMVPQIQGIDGEVSEEIDRLLAAGNVIDHPTMNRLFRTIVPKLEMGWNKLDDSRKIFASVLTKMRVFDTLHFDKLMADWISHIRCLKSRPQLVELFPILITSGCLTVSTLLRTANAAPPNKTSIETPAPGSAIYLQELLHLILTPIPRASLSSEEAYQFNIHQQSARSDDPKSMLSLIRNVLLEYSNLRYQAHSDHLLLEDDMLLQEKLRDVLRYLVVVDAAAVSDALNTRTLPSQAASFISKQATKLLFPGNDNETTTSFDRILGAANELTLPFCQLKLNFDLSMGVVASNESEDSAQSRFELFANAMDHAIEANNIMWTRMLPCLSSDISHRLKTLAYRRFLRLIPTLKSAGPVEATSNEHVHMAENLLGVIEAITNGQTASKGSELTVTLVEKLSDLWDMVAMKDGDSTELQQTVLDIWIPSLLRIIALHGSVPETVSTVPLAASSTGKAPCVSNQEIRARIVLVLCGLLLQLESLPSARVGSLAEKVFDVTAVLADSLPDDVRQQCAKSIILLPGTLSNPNVSSDARLYYLLSVHQPTPVDYMVLAHKEKPGMLLHSGHPRNMPSALGIGPLATQPKLTPFSVRRWEMLSESTPNVGENDTSLSLSLFETIKIQ